MAELFTDSLFTDPTLSTYQRFEGNSNDSSGEGNNGTDTNITYGTAYGKYGQGALFNGTTSKIVVADATELQNIFASGGSIGAWVKPASDGGGDSGRICEKDEAGNDGYLFFVQSEAAGFVKVNLTKRFSTTAGIWATTNAVVPLNTFSLVGVTYNASATTNDPLIYVNGVSVSVTETQTPVGTASSDVGNDLCIGNRPSDDARGWDGSMDEFFMFKGKVLAAADWMRLYQEGPGGFPIFFGNTAIA